MVCAPVRRDNPRALSVDCGTISYGVFYRGISGRNYFFHGQETLKKTMGQVCFKNIIIYLKIKQYKLLSYCTNVCINA